MIGLQRESTVASNSKTRDGLSGRRIPAFSIRRANRGRIGCVIFGLNCCAVTSLVAPSSPSFRGTRSLHRTRFTPASFCLASGSPLRLALLVNSFWRFRRSSFSSWIQRRAASRGSTATSASDAAVLTSSRRRSGRCHNRTGLEVEHRNPLLFVSLSRTSSAVLPGGGTSATACIQPTRL